EVGHLLLAIPLEQLDQDRFFCLEVRVDGPFGVASFLGDHVNGGAAKAMSGENLSRSDKQPLSSLSVAFCAGEPDPLVHDTFVIWIPISLKYRMGARMDFSREARRRKHAITPGPSPVKPVRLR